MGLAAGVSCKYDSKSHESTIHNEANYASYFDETCFAFGRVNRFSHELRAIASGHHSFANIQCGRPRSGSPTSSSQDGCNSRVRRPERMCSAECQRKIASCGGLCRRPSRARALSARSLQQGITACIDLDSHLNVQVHGTHDILETPLQLALK